MDTITNITRRKVTALDFHATIGKGTKQAIVYDLHDHQAAIVTITRRSFGTRYRITDTQGRFLGWCTKASEVTAMVAARIGRV